MAETPKYKILIGRSPVDNSLLASVERGEKRINVTIGRPQEVPLSVSRCQPEQGSAHAMLTIGPDRVMTLCNLKPQNKTLVNGREIERKTLTREAVVELGPERYKVDIDKLLKAADNAFEAPVSKVQRNEGANAAVPPPAPLNIKHLEAVWNNYNNGLKDLAEKQKKINLIRSGCGIFTMLTMPVCFLIGPVGLVFTVIGLAGNVYSFMGLKNDNTPERREQLMETFQDNYCCPNKQCNRFLGNYSYKLMKRQTGMQCPYCKSKFVE